MRLSAILGGRGVVWGGRNQRAERLFRKFLEKHVNLLDFDFQKHKLAWRWGIVGKRGKVFHLEKRDNMSSFKGSYTYAVDNKGRVSLPAKLRKSMSPDANDTVVITRGFEKCLYVYPLDEWTLLEQQLRTLSPYEAHDRLFLRRVMEFATDCLLDGQARITIPHQLLEYADIRDEVRIIGTLDKIELWDTKLYDLYVASQSETYEEIAAKVMRRS